MHVVVFVEFPEPDAATREALWPLHLPGGAPLADDVGLPELAAWYALSAAEIKQVYFETHPRARA